MSYIGRQPTVGNFQICDAISVVNNQAAYTMQVSSVNVSPETANHMLVSLNGVLQAPGSSYTVSGSTITFASNLVTGDVINFIHILGSVLDLGVPSDATVTAAKLASTSVTAAKLNNDIISGTTALTSEPADTDEFLVSDAGTLKRIDYSLIKGGGSLVKLASTTISSGVAAVSFNSTYINSTYDNYRVIAYGLSTAADNQDIALRMSVDNGSNFATHKGVFNYTQIDGGSVNQDSIGSRTSIPMGSDEEADASGGTNFIIDLMNLNSTAQYKFGSGLGTTVNQNGSYYAYRVHGYIASNTAVNFFKIFTEAGGNLDGGTVTLYGYEK